MPKATMDNLYCSGATLENSPVVVTTFDGSKWEVIGKITLPIHIGPTTFDITFQVMDIQLAYSCLFGKPWIHASRAVPSSLHQKVKFIVDQQLISVMGEKELMVSTPLLVEYVEGDEEAFETSFQALEIVGTTNAEIEGGDPRPSRAMIMAAKVLISNGFQPDKGPGKELDGMIELVALQENMGRSRLGYMGTVKKERPGWKTQSTQWIHPSPYHYFTSGGIISLYQIIVIEDQLLKLVEWIDNATLMPDNANESSRKDEREGPEEEALIELKRMIERERPRIQSRVEDLEVINLGGGEETREIRRLVELSKECANIFAWSYRDMPGLDTAIVKHRLPLIPNAAIVEKDEAIGSLKNQRGGGKTVEERLPGSSRVPPMGGQHSVCPQEGWEDLNRASLKDNFPLTHINMLVDNTTQHTSIPSWMASLDTIRSEWPQRIRKIPLSSSPRESSATR
ncbi:hypothetical protein CR513_38633, partial [Mucuna pruriens]